MKTKINKIFIALFLLICLIPSTGMLFSGPSPLLANEVSMRHPSFLNADGHLNLSVLTEASNYFGSRFALRPYLVSVRSFLYEKLLHSSAEDQVLVGKDGQLYYTETEDDYCGISLSSEELSLLVEKLAAIQEAVEAHGSTFVFTVAPNKSTIVPSGMPDRFPSHPEASNLRQLIPLMQEAGIHYVDLSSPLAEDPEYYYKTDSHWTAEGAAVAADTLLSALSCESRYAEGPFAIENTRIGDLYEMMYPIGKGREAEVVYLPTLCYETASDPRGGNALRINTVSENGSGSLYCRRDSFGIALYPYLADAFENAEFSRSSDYSLEAFAGLDYYDVVILEIVERNLPDLLG